MLAAHASQPQLYSLLPVAMETCFPAPLSPYVDITALSPLSPSFSLVWPSDWMQQYSLRGETIYIEEVVKTQRTTSTDRHDCL